MLSGFNCPAHPPQGPLRRYPPPRAPFQLSPQALMSFAGDKPVYSPVPCSSWQAAGPPTLILDQICHLICLMITGLSMGPNSVTKPMLLTLLVRWLANAVVTLSSQLTLPHRAASFLLLPDRWQRKLKTKTQDIRNTGGSTSLISLEQRPCFNN